MGTLETKLYGLAWLDAAVPAQVTRGVRVAAGYSRVPGARQACATGVGPVDVPTVNRRGAFVGNADRAHKT